MSARRSYYFVHRWVGVVLGTALVTVLFTGTVAVFADSLAEWASSSPRVSGLKELSLSGRLDTLIGESVAEHDPKRAGKLAVFEESNGDVRIALTRGPEAIGDPVVVDFVNATGKVLETNSGRAPGVFAPKSPANSLKQFFVGLHVSFLIPGKLGVWLTGITAMAMLMLAASGVYVYWPSRKRMARPPRLKGARTLIGDLHTLLGAWTLPFTALAGATGVFFSFATSLLLPVLALVYFQGDIEAAVSSVAPRAHVTEQAQVARLAEIFEDAEVRSGNEVRFVGIERSKDGGGLLVSVSTERHGWALTRELRLYDGHTGQFIQQAGVVGQVPSLGGTILSAMHGLHFGTTAGLATQILWFVLGLSACVLAGSGLSLWAVREEGKVNGQALRLLAHLSLALPLGFCVTVFVWAMGTHTGVHVNHGVLALGFFGASFATAALATRLPSGTAFRRVLWATAGALLLVPLAGVIATGQAPWRNTTAVRVDLALLLFAAASAWLASRVPDFSRKLTSAPSKPTSLRLSARMTLGVAGAFIGSIVVSLATAVTMVELVPPGPAGVDHFLVALALFPVTWIAYALLIVFSMVTLSRRRTRILPAV
ncbi:MAG: PepSY-associated TM helix domain-containing protein [Myxococcota bacterium]